MIGLLLVLTTFHLGGCAFNPAPVTTRNQPPSVRIQHHEVAKGDTLFSIAWRYEKDMHKLARANGLESPYTLYVGQKLTLDTSRQPPAPQVTATPSIQQAPKKPPPRNEPKKAPVVNQGQPRRLPRATSPASPASPTTRSPPPDPVYRLPAGAVRWRWPAKGAVSRHYDTGRVFKGINIQSAPGRTVHAAADGIVVYAGNGLRGYGNLIIIRHSDIYLSAYAHNRKLKVKEGARVASGTEIALVGGDPANRGRLYFEIRKNGKPVDPTKLLPRL